MSGLHGRSWAREGMVRRGRTLVGGALALWAVLSTVGAPRPAPAVTAVAAQTPPPAQVAISKFARGGNQFETGQPITFVLSFSCNADLTSRRCERVVITDSLPDSLSWDGVEFGGSNLPADRQYDAATGVATFNLGDVPDGATGTIEITTRFPAGTPSGTPAMNQATITAANASTDTAQADVTSRGSSSPPVLDKRRPSGPVQLDVPVTYRLTTSFATDGAPIRNARAVDQLPAGAEFVSATGGGTYVGATNQVTWTLGDLDASASPIVLEVTVLFRSSSFATGAEVENWFELTGTGDSGPVSYRSNVDRATLRPQGLVPIARKQRNRAELGPGQFDTYTLSGTAPDTADLTSLMITDRLPAGLVAVQDGAPNLSGSGPSPVVEVRVGGGIQSIPVTGAGGGWSATVPPTSDEIIVTFGAVPAGVVASFVLRAGIPSDGIGRDGQPVAAGTVLRNCAEVSGEASGSTVITRSACVTQEVVPLQVQFVKQLSPPSAPSAVARGEPARWTIDVAVPDASASPLNQPVITDCLPSGFDLDPADPAVATSTTGFDPAPSVVRTPAGCPDGRVRLTWSWPTPFSLDQGQAGTITVSARAGLQATPGPSANEATLTADNLPEPLTSQVAMAITSPTLLEGRILVHGDRDDGVFVGAGTEGQTSPGGTVTYVAEVTNSSGVPVTDLVIVDILPTPGDTGVRTTTARGSTWQPVLTSPGSSPQAPVRMEYSASSNPCRPEVGFTGNCDEAATWSTTPPGGQLSAARALRASFGDFVLAPGQTAALTWTMTTPADTPLGAVAWNSFAYVADRVDPREPLEASEPAKVGVRVVGQQGGQVGIRFVKLINGQAAPDPPGLIVTEGDRLVFSYQVTNTGTVPLSQLAVVDDVLGSVPCPRTSLDPGESMTCVAPPQVAIAGQHTNIGTVLGLPMTDGQGQVAPLAVDPANYFADSKTQPLIGIVKRINGRHTSRPPGLDIPPGAPVTFTYEVRNGGALPLVDVRVADDKLTGVTCDDVSLRPHTTTTCTAPVQTAIEGSYANEATATAQPTDPAGNPVGPTVSATDRAYYTNTLSVTGGRTGPMVVTGAVLLVAGAGLVTLTRPRAGRDRRAAPG